MIFGTQYGFVNALKMTCEFKEENLSVDFGDINKLKERLSSALFETSGINIHVKFKKDIYGQRYSFLIFVNSNRHSVLISAAVTANPALDGIDQVNFTSSSDIDWSKPIAEIDQQLYVKYGLTKDEIDFVESKVKEMV